MTTALLVTGSRTATTRRGTSYWRLEVRRPGDTDATVCICWDPREQTAPPVGSLILDAVVENDDYNGQPQLKLTRYGHVVTPPAPADLVPFKTPNVLNDPERERAVLFSPVYYDAGDDVAELMRAVVVCLQDDGDWDKLLDCPGGAKNHHAVRGGLLQHLYEMLQVMEALQSVAWLEPLVDWQLLRAAIALHDIGKIDEYDCDALAWSPTHRGKMLGHPAIGAQLVNMFWPRGGDWKRGERLQHAILCHHGRSLSPVTPCTIEATLLHSIDGISATSSVFRDLPHGTYSGMLGTEIFKENVCPAR